MLRITENEYYNNRSSAVKNDLRRTWKEVKSVIYENNNCDVLPTEIKLNNHLEKDPKYC